MPQTLSLPAELTIYTAAETRAAWLAWLAAETADPAGVGPCRADAQAVDEVDAAGGQLVLSLANTLLLQQRVLQLINASEPLRQACAALGASALLDATPAR